MRSQFAAALALVAAALSFASAQTYPNQTAPFRLKLCSDNSTIDGAYLYSCHSGAAIEQLCLGNQTWDPRGFGTYYLNYSDWSAINGMQAGNLVWNMPYTNGGNTTLYESEPLNFAFSATSNVAVLLFEPSEQYTVPLGFDGDNKLFIYNYVDDTVFPPNATGGYHLYYHWQACVTYFLGYQYRALAWATTGTPVNPSCHAVNVTREFI
jgi:hypothetical protein